MHSYLVVPVVARGVLSGLADFVRTGDRPGFDQADVSLATELFGKAAVAVDNARLYQRERDTVVPLQHSLLPRESPPTLRVPARHRARRSSDPPRGGVAPDLRAFTAARHGHP